MHFLPDTEDADAAAERFWPDAFKQVIQRELRPKIGEYLNERSLEHIYQRQYQDLYTDSRQFVEKIIDMTMIGAVNGADRGFESIYQAFLAEASLPAPRPYARYLWPHVFSGDIKTHIHQSIVLDYRPDDGFQHAYRVGYAKTYASYEEFICYAAGLVVEATEKGVDDMLGLIYRAFLARRPLPPARRNPKRLKQY